MWSVLRRVKRTFVGVCRREDVATKMLVGVKYGRVERRATTAVMKRMFSAVTARGGSGTACCVVGARRER